MKRTLVIAALAASSSVFTSVASAQAAQAIAVTLTEFKLGIAHDTVKAGPVTFKVKNAGGMAHGLYVRGPGVEKGTKDIPAGQDASLAVTLKPGTYEVFCPVSDLSHKAAGMTHTLVVVPAAAAPPAPAKKKPGA